MMNFDEIKQRFNATINEMAETLYRNSEIIDYEKIAQFIDHIIKAYTNNRMVFLYGAGRSGFIGRCFTQRLMHLGIKACFISDTVTYRYKTEDLLIIISGSGETISPNAIAKKAKEIGGTLVLLTANPLSSIARLSDLIIQVEGKTKDNATVNETYAPYTSLFDISTLAILDTIAGIVMETLGVSEIQIDNRHASLE
ncbi:MAG: SIS domain-containing protein [Promethearchaeota archaeon]|nr:MAG: SIS domain-containing protein [Candidatus Lokiarchaeota archaeon]